MQTQNYASHRDTGQHLCNDPIAGFSDFLASLGMQSGREGVIDDNTWRRCDAGNESCDSNDGSYVLAVDPDGFGYGYAHNHKTGEGAKWSTTGFDLTPERRAQMDVQREAARKEAARVKAEKLAASMEEFYRAQPCQSHAYFTEKGVPVPADLRVNESGSALVPVYHKASVVGFERILARQPEDGPRKRCCSGGLGEGYHWADGTESTVYVTEGIAKSMAIHSVTGARVFTGFGQGRLLACAKLARSLHPHAQIIVAGDQSDDPAKGPQKAQEAARAASGVCVLPPLAGEDWDDIQRLRGPDALLEALLPKVLDGEILEPGEFGEGWSEDALAVELGRRGWDDNARYVPSWGSWLFWDGVRWRKDEKRQDYTLIRQYLRARAAEYVALMHPDEPQKARREVEALRSSGKVAAIARLAQSNPASAASHRDFDGDPMLLGTPSGTVDLRTGILRNSWREDMLTKSTAVEPSPVGTVPFRWLAFLDQIFGGDREVIRFMQRLAGYSLTGKTTEEKLFFFSGTGGNGKSIFLNTLTGLMGEYAQRASAETFLLSFGDKHSTSTAALEGARLVVGSELPKGRQWNDAIIKDLTGGDTIRARYMRQDEFEFTPQLTLMIAGNTKPSFGAVDAAMRRRVVLIPFEARLVRPVGEPDLKDALPDEWPAILQWAIEGAVEWHRQGLAVPARIETASTEYMDSEDEIGQFIADCAAEAPSAWVARTDLLSAYQGWCISEKVKEMSRTNFYKAVEERHFRRSKRQGTEGFSGLKLA